jgi:hypothetical protein
MKFFPACLVAVGFCLAACAPAAIDSIQREDLFTLDIGPMEDQIALYGLEGKEGIQYAGIAMRDGFFFIADNNGGKIVRYNSYGDLLFMIYNDSTSPAPVDLRIKTDDGVQLTRWASTYPLRSPGKIAVDSRKHIYTEERLPNERYSYDGVNKTLLDSIILHFDADGQFIEYLGQGGRGGGPFPNIAGLYASADDDIAVICRLPSGWNVYWYNTGGEQLFLVQIRNDAIPELPDRPYFTALIDSVMAAPDMRKLYIKIDYYREIVDSLTNTRTSTEPYTSLIWILDVERGSYESYVETPFYEYRFSENNRTVHVNLLYSMLGLVEGGGILLYFPIEDGYTLLRMDSAGRGQRRGIIHVDPGELRFHDFYLSPEGILSALLADEWKIKVAWWRMDKFMRDVK